MDNLKGSEISFLPAGEYQKYQTEVSWTRPKCDCFEVGLEHCFVTSEAPFRFPELILVPIERQKRDLQLWNCPRASAKQGGCLFSELHFLNVFAKVWWIWDLVLSPVRRH